MAPGNNCLVVSIILIFSTVGCSKSIETFTGLPRTNLRRSTCTYEIENANKTIANWAVTMRQMIVESSLPSLNRKSIAEEEGKIQDLIEGFGANLNKKPIERLVKDLVSIRRRSNRMALDIYLRTFDMRWPQTSVKLGVAVERVQQACLSNLDRVAMLVLNSHHGKVNKSPTRI